MNLRKGIVLVVIALLIAAFFLFDVGGYLTLENLKSQQESLVAWQQAKPWQSALVFLVYVVVTALSLPGATDHDAGNRSDFRAVGRYGSGLIVPLQSALPWLSLSPDFYSGTRCRQGLTTSSEQSIRV